MAENIRFCYRSIYITNDYFGSLVIEKDSGFDCLKNFRGGIDCVFNSIEPRFKIELFKIRRK